MSVFVRALAVQLVSAVAPVKSLLQWSVSNFISAPFIWMVILARSNLDQKLFSFSKIIIAITSRTRISIQLEALKKLLQEISSCLWRLGTPEGYNSISWKWYLDR